MTGRITAAAVDAALRRIEARLDPLRDELNAADRALGDGDTGMTVANVVSAWMKALPPAQDDLGALLQQLGRETRRVSGSSLGSVLAIGLTAAGKAAPASADAAAMAVVLGAAADAITERSGAIPGDKTILDSLLAVRDAVAAGRDHVEAAAAALDEFRGREARIGRARIYGAKSAGQDDPGMLAALLLLRAAQGAGR